MVPPWGGEPDWRSERRLHAWARTVVQRVHGQRLLEEQRIKRLQLCKRREHKVDARPRQQVESVVGEAPQSSRGDDAVDSRAGCTIVADRHEHVLTNRDAERQIRPAKGKVLERREPSIDITNRAGPEEIVRLRGATRGQGVGDAVMVDGGRLPRGERDGACADGGRDAAGSKRNDRKAQLDGDGIWAVVDAGARDSRVFFVDVASCIHRGKELLTARMHNTPAAAVVQGAPRRGLPDVVELPEEIAVRPRGRAQATAVDDVPQALGLVDLREIDRATKRAFRRGLPVVAGKVGRQHVVELPARGHAVHHHRRED
eukprot:m.92430 g.92430  ORF g.92430 m.92430 type:complete len:315 (+) comp8512_c0_seq1:102-1046(+)